MNRFLGFFSSVNLPAAQPAVKYHGLMNQGSTCYLNSVLQVLFMTREFREAVIRFATENPDSEPIDGDLKELFDDLLERETYTFKITRTLGITRVYEQQDAAEYFERILGRTSPKAAEIFHGQMANRTTCSECETRDESDGPFWHLPLDLVDSSSGNYSVEEGIQKFFTATHVSGDDQMYCDHCDAKVDATSRYVIKHHPDVLILLLKRFDFSYKSMSYIKINRAVDVPHTLKIPEKQTYELYAVVDHSGDLRSGHYVATIKPQDEDRWYSFDDSRVSQFDHNPFPDNETKSSTRAYLLFYRKKGIKTRKRPLDTKSDDDDSGLSKKKPCDFPGDSEKSAVPASYDEQDEISDGQRIEIDKTTGINKPTEEEEEEETENSDSKSQKVKDEDSDDREEGGDKLCVEDQNIVNPENNEAPESEKVEPNDDLDFKPEDSQRSSLPAAVDEQGEMINAQMLPTDVTTDDDKKSEDEETHEAEKCNYNYNNNNLEKKPGDRERAADHEGKNEINKAQRSKMEKNTSINKPTKEEEEQVTGNSDRRSQKEKVKDEDSDDQEEEGDELSDEDQNKVKNPENEEAPESGMVEPNDYLDFKPEDSQRSAEQNREVDRNLSQQELTDRKTEGEIIKQKSEDQDEKRALTSYGEQNEKADLAKTEDRQTSAAHEGQDEISDGQRIKMDKTTGINKQTEEEEEEETGNSDSQSKKETVKEEDSDDQEEEGDQRSDDDQPEVNPEDNKAPESEKLEPNDDLDFKPEDSQRSSVPAAVDEQDERINAQMLPTDVTTDENKQPEDEGRHETEKSKYNNKNNLDFKPGDIQISAEQNIDEERRDLQLMFTDRTGSDNKETEERTDSSGSPSEDMREKDENTDEEEDLKNIMDLTNKQPTEISETWGTMKDKTDDEKKQEDSRRSDEQNGQDQRNLSQQELTDRKTEGEITEDKSEEEEEKRALVSTGEQNEKADLTETEEKKDENSQISAAHEGQDEISDGQRIKMDKTTGINKQTEEEEEEETGKKVKEEDSDDQEEEGDQRSDEDHPEVNPEDNKAPESEKLEPNDDLDFKPGDSQRSSLPAAVDEQDEMINAQMLPTDVTTDNKQSEDEGIYETKKSKYNNNNNPDNKPGDIQISAEQNIVEERRDLQLMFTDRTGSNNKQTEEKTNSSGSPSEEMREKDNADVEEDLKNLMDLTNKQPMEISEKLSTVKDTTGSEKKPTEKEEEETGNSDNQSKKETGKDEDPDGQEEEGDKRSDEEQPEVNPEKKEEPKSEKLEPNNDLDFKPEDSQKSAAVDEQDEMINAQMLPTDVTTDVNKQSEDEEKSRYNNNNNLGFKPRDSERSVGQNRQDKRRDLQLMCTERAGSENKQTEERTNSSGSPSEEMREKDENTDEEEDLKNVMDLTNKQPTEISETWGTMKDKTDDEKKQEDSRRSDEQNGQDQRNLSQQELTDRKTEGEITEDKSEEEEEKRGLVSTGEQNEEKDPGKAELTETEEKKDGEILHPTVDSRVSELEHLDNENTVGSEDAYLLFHINKGSCEDDCKPFGVDKEKINSNIKPTRKASEHHSDEGPLEEGRSHAEQTVSGENTRQKNEEDADDSHRQSGKRTPLGNQRAERGEEMKKENHQVKASRESQGAAEGEHRPKQKELQIKIIEEEEVTIVTHGSEGSTKTTPVRTVKEIILIGFKGKIKNNEENINRSFNQTKHDEADLPTSSAVDHSELLSIQQNHTKGLLESINEEQE